MEYFPNWADHIVAFIFCVLLPLQAIRQTTKPYGIAIYDSQQKRTFYFSTCISLFIMAAIILSVWLLFKRPLAEIGLTAAVDIQSAKWTVIAFVILYSIDFTYSLTPKNIAAAIPEWEKRTPFMPTKTKELPAYLVLCLCAGVFEEIIYRGYLITYFRYLLDVFKYQETLSVVLSALVCSISHFYHSKKDITKAFILSILFGIIVVQSGSLLIVMFMHFLNNLIGGLLTIKYLNGKEVKA
ncbi:MAG TPA: CPBP family intramembrane glutamic endopeptidase [Chryseolinea sp.]